ncbi:MAG: hypothetical protein EBZ67_14190 [Chitinophagia bacterium]|nr:hypothetical protein [Chitinophagia bacterium]
MPVNPSTRIPSVLLLAGCLASVISHAQPVSGQWKGRLGGPALGLGRSFQVELRILRTGDSLIGVANYRTLGNNHVRMPVRGYFNPFDGTVSWWHAASEGVDEKGRTAQDLLPAGMVFDTDFNCPDGSTLKLDGLASLTTWSGRSLEMPVHLQKTGEADFQDPWERSIVGEGGEYDIPPSAERPTVRINPPKEAKQAERPDPTPVRREPEVKPDPKPVVVAPPPPVRREPEVRPDPKPVVVTPPPPVDRQQKVSDPVEKPVSPILRPSEPPTPDAGVVGQWLKNRDRKLVEEIEVSGDTLWLNFYDHAEVDGDSISIFLGNRLLASHILLKATPHTMGIPLTDISDSAELTSLLILYVEGVRHEARLESTERTSAMIRFRKTGSKN